MGDRVPLDHDTLEELYEQAPCGYVSTEADGTIVHANRTFLAWLGLDETVIIFSGEFGRTPFSQGSDGRDHNPFGFSLWMAGGGIKGGAVLGATDELGYHAVQDPCTTYDLWATVLHLLGLDHERLTYRFGGRDFRLTDVHGEVMRSIIA